jgi:hypothetical protein
MKHTILRNQLPTLRSNWIIDQNEFEKAKSRAINLGIDNSIIQKIQQPRNAEWECVFAVDGDTAGSGTFFLPKFWRDHPNWTMSGNSNSILKGYPCLFEFFRLPVSTEIKLSLRAEMPDPHTALNELCNKLKTPKPKKKEAKETKSPACWNSHYEPHKSGPETFGENDYNLMQIWLERLIIKGELTSQNHFTNFKHLVFLAPAFI